MSRRVVVTGMGLISCFGSELEANWQSLISGRCGIDFLSSFPEQQGAEVKAFVTEEHIENKKILKILCKGDIYGLVAAKIAMTDAEFPNDEVESQRKGIYLGCMKEMNSPEQIFEAVWNSKDLNGKIDSKKFGENAQKYIYPLFLVQGLPNGCLFAISTMYSFQGVNANIMNSGVASAQAVGEAFRAIQRGEADICIAGGFYSIDWITLSGLVNLGLISKNNGNPKKIYCPFDKTRKGFVIGEGAGMLVIEELSFALNRSAKIYGEIVGYSSTCDAYQYLKPAPSGESLAKAIRGGLEEAMLRPKDVDYINAYGSGTIVGDRTETLAIKKAFGENAYYIPISTIKPMIGHLLAASGSVELIVTLLTINKKIIPPTINYEYLDLECDLDYTPNIAKKVDIKTAVSISRGMGTENTVIVVKKFP